MKAMTLYQPWAGAMALGLKTIETRGWRMEYRGPMAIHAGAHKPSMEDWECLPYNTRNFGNEAELDLCRRLSAILAVVDVFDCIRTEVINKAVEEGVYLTEDERLLGNYSPGRFGILTRNLRVLRHPVPCKGMQGLWIVPDDVAALVLAEIL
jgi:hypothetical protein